ncbi:MAG: hypothetical protein AAGA74_06460 [Pseudomonadota bacterium]
MKIGRFTIRFESPDGFAPTENKDGLSVREIVLLVLVTIMKVVILIGLVRYLLSPDSPVGFVGGVIWFVAMFLWLFWGEIQRIRITRNSDRISPE